MSSPEILKAFAELQLSFVQTHCPTHGGFSTEPEEVKKDIFTFLDAAPALITDLLNLILSHVDAVALAQGGAPFASLSNAKRADVVKTVASSAGGYDEVTLVARLVWLVIYSRDLSRNCIGFTLPPNLPAPVSVPPPPAADLTRRYQVCVIGSGAGGALVAARLAEKGRDVLLIDAGAWVNPKDYPVRDDQALSMTFRDAGLHPAWPDLASVGRPRGLSFMTVLQARLFGGGPAINNAIHLPITEGKWGTWRNAHDFPVEWQDLKTALDTVAADLGVSTTEMRDAIGERSTRLEDGFNDLAWLVRDLPLSVFECVACGGCNVGCRFGKKTGGVHGPRPAGKPRSYLQKAFDLNVTMRPRLRAVRFVTALGSRKVQSLLCEDIANQNHQVEIQADKFVLSAGPMASSRVLHRSGIQILSPVGRGIAANIVFPVFALLDRDIPPGKLNPGIQMCVYVHQGGRLLESWFHYPGSIAAAIPGWFADHADIMAKYPRMAACGVVVPTGNRGFVGWPHGQLVLSLSEDELIQMKAGVESVADAFFADGAEKVIPATRLSCILDKADPEAGKATFRQLVQGPADLSLSTAHPQGGNALGRSAARSVVSPGFNLYDFDNLFIADASLFPAGCGVNPQMTTMALAHLAVERM
jgi:choline dehydrogenase-like flavoprotein